MKLKIAEIKSVFLDRLFDIPVNSIPKRGTKYKNNRIKATLSSIISDHKNYRLLGHINTTINYECVRCLEFFDSKVSLPFNILLGGDSNNSPSFIGTDYIKLTNSMNDIDIGPLFADYIALEKPINPICNKECKGLCTICGVKKTNIPCDCTNEVASTVWDELKKLKFN